MSTLLRLSVFFFCLVVSCSFFASCYFCRGSFSFTPSKAAFLASFTASSVLLLDAFAFCNFALAIS